MKIVFLLLAALPFLGLNYRQLYSAWAIRSETKRLTRLAEHASDGFRNPAPMTDFFDEKSCSRFWKFTIINGNGKVSNEAAWHSDVQSGIGFVNNALMFDHVQKSVVYADFAPPIDLSLASALENYLLFQQDTRYQFNPSAGNLFKLVWRALTIK